ncbi:MAG: M28 family peptidase, partial [Gemmatimonadota bacterium]|nr:M28 family peptidase [Gemmatimonadota bacterium]
MIRPVLLNRLLACLAFLPLVSGCQRSKTGFDGDAAYRYARIQVSFGPRIPGSPGWQKAGDWIAAQMRSRADTVIEQRWTHKLANGDSIPLRNILARFRPGAIDRVLYLTHWDTRPVADNDPNPANRTKPILGANDGASGVGLFVALGDLLKKTPPNVGVDLLFVDGEDYGTFGPPDVDVLMGSTYFASHLPSPGYQPIFGVLFDMIGDKDLNIYQEQNSVARAPEVVNRVWQAAAGLGYAQYFIPTPKYAVTDDHIPLLQAGLRVIDVIDIDYGPANNSYHHTLADTMDKISAKSLGIVGDVAATLV